MPSLIPKNAKRLWDEWNLRCAVLISLLFQILLIVSANSRKTRGRSVVLTAIIWLCYLLADWIAAFSVGLISSGQTNDCPEKNAVNKQLAAFWAPFLLLHLGGPDAITAFSLEDNELWIRHFFGLVIQLVAVVYVFFQSLPNDYWIPTVLMFFAGACKYAERTMALYYACLGNFKRSLLPKPDPGPNYAQFMEEYSGLTASHVPVDIKIVKEPGKADSASGVQNGGTASSSTPHPSPTQPKSPSDKLEGTIQSGYKYFEIFKGLVVDHMFSFHERNESREFFCKKEPLEAFEVLEVELNFMYDVLYTKYGLVHCWIGYLCHFLCTILMVMCFQQFASHHQHKITACDKIITYVLLCGAVCLDLVGMYNLVFSDWFIVLAKKYVPSMLTQLKKYVPSMLTQLPFRKRGRRWSNTMFQHSLLSFCLTKRYRWLDTITDFVGIKDTLDEFQYKKKIKCENGLKELIFTELKGKADKAQTKEDVKEVYSARGEWVLLGNSSVIGSVISSSLGDETEYDESLLLWHIATELCYFSCTVDNPKREICKHLSDYMLYLLVMKSTLMSAVAGIAQIRYQDTCEEARKFFKRWETAVDEQDKACDRLLKVKTDVKPNEVKGDRSKSLLFDACILAKDLKKLLAADVNRGWKMMSEIWVELLCYAAGHCRADVHARLLSQGGELITFVWLLMVHFGLGDQFRIEAGHARAKLLVHK